MDRNSNTSRKFGPPTLAWLVYLLPFAAALVFVAIYGVDVPFSDQWRLPGLFVDVAARRGILAGLLECNNVHPVFFPKLIWIGLAFATNWNVRVDMFVTVLTVLPVLIACAHIAAKEKGAAGWPVKASIFVSSLLLFSFVHYDTFLWGFNLSFTVINAAVVLAICLISTSHAHPVRGLLLAWACCIVASFSSLQGMLSWIVILPCLPVLFSTRRGRAVTACGTVLLGAVCVALYFLAFTHVTDLGGHPFWREHPATAAGFLLAVLGEPVAPGSFILTQRIAWPIGALVLALFGFGVWRMRTQWRVAAPWVSMALFSIGFATMAAVGRSEWGVSGAVTAGSRYFSGSVLLTVAAIQLSRQALSNRKSSRVWFLALIMLIGACAAWRSASSVAIASDVKQGRDRAAACVQVLNYIDAMTDNHWESCLFPVSIPLEEWGHLTRRPAQMLDSLGWHKLAANVRFVDEPGTSRGWIDQAPDGDTPKAVGPDDWIYCSGRVTASYQDRYPRFVLFTVGDRRRFIYATVVRPTSGWTERIPAKFFPAGTSELVAWAYDEQQQSFIRLKGSKPINKLGASIGVSQTASASVREQHPAFLGGEVPLGNGDYSLTFPDGKMFGYYTYYLSNIFIYHFDMGYEFVYAAPSGAVQLYDVASGHLWYTRADLFPSLWDSTLNAWVSYLPDSKDPGRYSANPRYFENLSTHQIFTM